MSRRPSIKVGDIFTTNNGGDVVVLVYKSYIEVLVEFVATGTNKWCQAGDLRKGNVRDQHQASLYGVGITGDVPTEIKGVRTPVYEAWKRMLERCYSDNFHKTNPTYVDCTVCEEWKFLPNFKEWFDENYIEGYQLDKDTLLKSNKLYSPETCRYIPQRLNSLLVKNNVRRGNYKIGVSLYTRNKINPYVAQVQLGSGDPEHIGYYPTEEDAFQAYKKTKEVYIKQEAKYYYDLGQIDLEFKIVLDNYIVEDSD